MRSVLPGGNHISIPMRRVGKIHTYRLMVSPVLFLTIGRTVCALRLLIRTRVVHEFLFFTSAHCEQSRTFPAFPQAWHVSRVCRGKNIGGMVKSPQISLWTRPRPQTRN